MNFLKIFLKKNLYILLSYGFVSPLTNFLIHLKKPRFFVKYLIHTYSNIFKVNLEEAEKNIDDYQTVLEFFTRKLKKGIRPIIKKTNSEIFISPVDGEIVEQGSFSSKEMAFKIKNSFYPIKDLVGEEVAPLYQDGGKYISIYLSPKDYHRIHHPFSSVLKTLFFIKGRVFPVNHFSTSEIKNVFTRNKRLVAHYQKKDFIFTNVMVAALNVGGIKTTFDKQYNHQMTKRHFKKIDKKVTQGDEAFVFELGSSIVLLFPNTNKKKVNFLKKKGKLKMGEGLVELK